MNNENKTGSGSMTPKQVIENGEMHWRQWLAVGLTIFLDLAIVGFYSAWAVAYPTHVRATETGFALSAGRGGAALSPCLAGLFFAADLGLLKGSIIISFGSLASLFLISMVNLKDAEEDRL